MAQATYSPDMNCTAVLAQTLVSFSKASADGCMIGLVLGISILTLWWVFFACYNASSFCGGMAWLRLLSCGMCSVPEKSRHQQATSEHVRKLCVLMRAERIRVCCQVAGWLLPPFMVAEFSIQLPLVNGLGGDDRIASMYSILFESTKLDRLLCGFIVLYLASGKKTNPRTADILFCFLFLFMGLHNTLVSNDMNYIWLYTTTVQLQFCIAIALCNPRALIIPNLINFLWGMMVIWSTPALRINGLWYSVGAVFTFGFMQGGAMQTETWLMAEARSKVREHVKDEAASSLLSVICDAVVHLRENFVLREPCPKLTDGLLRGATGQGKDPERPRFISFLVPSDINRFKSFVRQKSNRPGEAAACHVHLVERGGAHVPVQIYHTALPDVDGHMYHLIGIREESFHDFPGSSRKSVAPVQPVEPPTGSSIIQAPKRAPLATDEVSSATPSSSTSAISSQSGFHGQDRRSRMRLTLAFDPPHQVQTVSKSVFRHFNIPPLARPGTVFGDWLADPAPFAEWLRHGTAEVLATGEGRGALFGPTLVCPCRDEQQAEPKLMLLSVKILPPGAARPGITIDLLRPRRVGGDDSESEVGYLVPGEKLPVRPPQKSRKGRPNPSHV